MIRLTLLWLVILGILGYTWKDWYRGICGLIVLMAVIEHPDMPKSILGIPGLNPWNLLLFNGILAWLSQRRKEGLHFDLPRKITVLLILYLCVVVVGFVRIIGDTSVLTLYYREGMTYFFTEYMINTIKWVIPGLLLFDGCRTEERFRLAVFSILSVFVLLSIQVAKWMPPTYAVDAEALERRSLKVLVSGIGYHRVNLSAMLSGASWAILCTTVIIPRGKRWIAVLTALFVVYAQMMTGGRAGYGAWVAVGIVMCVLKWRRYLLLIPTAALLASLVLPGVVGRALEGFTADTHDTNKRLDEQRSMTIEGGEQSSVDSYTVTAGRSLAWPLVIDKIMKRPLTGYGRQAMLRTGIATYLYDTLGELFPHPHNAYLEMLLDNGIIGFVIVLSFYALMLFYSMRNFLDRESPTCSAIGGVSTALMLGLLVSAMGSQTFYPREGWDGMWAAMLVGLRVRMERQRRAAEKAEATGAPAEPAVERVGFAFPGRRDPGDVGWRPAPGLQPAAALALSTTSAITADRRATGARPAPGIAGHFRPRGTASHHAAPNTPLGPSREPAPTGEPAGRAARPLATQQPPRPSFARRVQNSSPGGPILHSGWLNAGVTDPCVWKWA